MKLTRKLTGLDLVVALTFFLLAGPLHAQQPTPQATPDPAQELAKAQKLVDGLHWQSGTISIPEAHVNLILNDNFKYLNSQDSDVVLEQLWNNPRQEGNLGMVFPKKSSPLDDDSWAVTIAYEDNGHTSDSDADSIDYNALMQKMKDEIPAENEEREKQGYSKIELVGWAAPPRYDKESHKLFWAKSIKFGDVLGLNYNFRVLGRTGVLVLDAIGSPNQLQEIDSKKAEILSMFEFTPGNRYADYNASTDRLAEGGLIGLIAAGGIYGAAKLGLLAVAGKFLIAFGKYIIIGVIALGGAVAKFFGNIFGQKTVKFPSDQDRRG